ncbi:TPA: cysteine synthase A [Candidatus Poribacteria bacterium]|nr:cysteine synthase A [Candidatus Poribacteria bacterium]
MRIYNSIAELIGDTPLLRLNRVIKDCWAEVVAKLEFFNPMSIKDRPAYWMIEKAEEEGRIRKDTTIIEASSGNMGIALAYICAIKGYRLILVMSEIQSIERRRILKAFGAELVLTPASLGTKGAREKALELSREIPNSFYICQHDNPANVEAHRRTTGKELWEDTEGKIDILVAGLGTTGTLMGVAKAIKPRKPEFRTVGVEPASAPMISQGKFSPHRMMGVSPGFIPGILERDLLDEVFLVEEDDAFQMCRALAREEGVLVGITSGACAFAAVQLARRPENRGKLIVCIFADTGERYLSVEGLFGE